MILGARSREKVLATGRSKGCRIPALKAYGNRKGSSIVGGSIRSESSKGVSAAAGRRKRYRTRADKLRKLTIVTNIQPALVRKFVTLQKELLDPTAHCE